MSISEKLKAFSSTLCGRSCSAVILAGGSGSRFSGDSSLPKQLVPICNTEMIIYSLKAFDACPLVRECVVVSRKEDISRLERVIKKYSFTKPIKIVSGGHTRQESALCGFNAISDSSAFVAIHDAARPLITPEAIEKVITAAYHSKAAIAAAKAVDTPKIVSLGGMIKEKAPERERLWLAQTPQVFEKDLYRTAAYYAKEKGFEATDDASLIENAGFFVKAVDTGITNFKVTHPDDLLLAGAIIQDRTAKEDKK